MHELGHVNKWKFGNVVKTDEEKNDELMKELGHVNEWKFGNIGSLDDAIKKELCFNGFEEIMKFVSGVRDEISPPPGLRETPGNERFDFRADIEQLIIQGKMTRQQARKLKRTLMKVLDGYLKAKSQGKDIEVWLKEIDCIEEDGKSSICPFGHGPEECEGLIDEGKWLRIRNGITMDSGSSVFVMPTGWMTMFLLEESEGSRKGQTYVAAAKGSKPILNEGQRTIKFFTSENEKRKVTCQVAGVNKILASVAQICDNGNDVLFRKHGGEIIHLASGKRTPFRRHGNIYVMDAWIPNPSHAGAEEDADEQPAETMSFTRPDGTR